MVKVRVRNKDLPVVKDTFYKTKSVIVEADRFMESDGSVYCSEVRVFISTRAGNEFYNIYSLDGLMFDSYDEYDKWITVQYVNTIEKLRNVLTNKFTNLLKFKKAGILDIDEGDFLTFNEFRLLLISKLTAMGFRKTH